MGVAWTAYHQEDKPSCGDGTKRRHCPLRGAGREYQLEKWDGVAEAVLQSAQRAISSVSGDEDALADQGRHSDTQQTVVPPAQRAPPHVGDGKQLLYSDSSVEGSKGQRPSRQLHRWWTRIVLSHLLVPPPSYITT